MNLTSYAFVPWFVYAYTLLECLLRAWWVPRNRQMQLWIFLVEKMKCNQN